ncbi:uncharacterized protein LOC119989517 isoform X2 [Tripterygium wilfordii]|uniref:uncharacterized protein LOC119989517 isoform X2 n=1 Tax=Tripterygium wilfordii TaxID=458696 RepID=UPI0018F831DD|nr:uncharacterized protein LOC119989517 isoform X2 [Tripterygium wilfordii]
MSPPAQTEIANKILAKRASNNRNRKSKRSGSLKWRGLEMAIKRARSRRASSKSLSFEELTADLNRLKAEMAERKPQRGSSERDIMRKRLADLQLLERGVAAQRGRIHSVAEYQNKVSKALDEVATRLLNEGLNPLPATVLPGHRIQDEIEKEPVFSGQFKIQRLRGVLSFLIQSFLYNSSKFSFGFLGKFQQS